MFVKDICELGRMDSKNTGRIFGEVLRRHRTKRGITQEELAFQAGVDRTFVYRLQRDIRLGTSEQLKHPPLVILREVAGSMRCVDCSDYASLRAE